MIHATRIRLSRGHREQALRALEKGAEARRQAQIRENKRELMRPGGLWDKMRAANYGASEIHTVVMALMGGRMSASEVKIQPCDPGEIIITYPMVSEPNPMSAAEGRRYMAEWPDVDVQPRRQLLQRLRDWAARWR